MRAPRIWTLDSLNKVVREARERLQHAAHPGPAKHEDGERPSAAVEPPSPPRAQPLPGGRTTMIGRAIDPAATLDVAAPRSAAPQRVNLAETRVHLIEHQLEKQGAEPHAQPAPAPAVPADRVAHALAALRALAPQLRPLLRFRPTPAQLRRSLIALLAVVAVVTWVLPKSEPVPALPVVARQAAPATKVAATHEAPKEHAAERTAAAAQLASTTVTPRQAVDALISGDDVAAQRLYAQLARASGGDPVYAEAARILDERVRARAY